MKKLFTLIPAFIALTVNAQMVHTITLRPNGATGNDATLSKENGNFNNGIDENFIANAWTSGGNGVTLRSVLQFALPTLPANATFVSATLTLYGNPTSVHPQLHSSYPGSPYGTTNEGWLRRVVSSWSESTVTWNNQPNTTTVNQVSLPASTSQTQDYAIDVTNLVKDMLNNPASSFGFMLSLQNETTYRALIFASSDHPDSTKRPKLIIVYHTPAASVSGVPVAGRFSVYPNPAQHTINLNFSSVRAANVEVKLADATGRTVMHQSRQVAANGQLNFDVADLPRGAYILTATEENKNSYSNVVTLQ